MKPTLVALRVWVHAVVGHRTAVSTGAALECCPVGKRFLCAFLGSEPTEVSGESQKVLSYVHAPKRISPRFLAPLDTVRQSLRLTQMDKPGGLRGAASSGATGSTTKWKRIFLKGLFRRSGSRFWCFWGSVRGYRPENRIKPDICG